MALVGFNSTVAGAVGTVDSTQKNDLGAMSTDGKGRVYIYLQGVASTLAGSWVNIKGDYTTSLLASGVSGAVAVATAAIGASKFGWYQVAGACAIALASSNGTIASGGGQMQVGGSGLVAAQGTSTGAANGDYIFGAFAYSAQPASDGAGADAIAQVYLNYPYIAVAAAVASS